MSIKYINLPIYSIAVNGQYIYFSGGGGGSTGIPNEIKIYHRNITPEPANSVPTGQHIIENLTVYQEKQLVVCNANADIVVYQSVEGGRKLQQKYRFQADFSHKDATINAICFSRDGDLLCTGGDDMTVKFFKIGEEEALLQHSYLLHTYPIKNVDHNQQDLYLSTDNHQIAICNLAKKQVVRTIYQDQLLPSKSLFQSAYFQTKGGNQILITHFKFKQATYITKEAKGKFTTLEIAEDQSCQTAFHRDHGLLGIACGNGTTMMFDSNKMKSLGKEQHHKFVITGCTITKRTNRFLTGTPQCSYNIQNSYGQLDFNWTILANLLFSLLIAYLLGKHEISKSQDLEL